MKYVLLIASALLLFSACGEQEAAQNTVDSAPMVEQQDVLDAVEATVEPEIDAAETQQVVEESAAEPETGEQKILLA
jgi:uncharacterized lipoprotein YajG